MGTLSLRSQPPNPKPWRAWRFQAPPLHPHPKKSKGYTSSYQKTTGPREGPTSLLSSLHSRIGRASIMCRDYSTHPKKMWKECNKAGNPWQCQMCSATPGPWTPTPQALQQGLQHPLGFQALTPGTVISHPAQAQTKADFSRKADWWVIPTLTIINPAKTTEKKPKERAQKRGSPTHTNRPANTNKHTCTHCELRNIQVCI